METNRIHRRKDILRRASRRCRMDGGHQHSATRSRHISRMDRNLGGNCDSRTVAASFLIIPLHFKTPCQGEIITWIRAWRLELPKRDGIRFDPLVQHTDQESESKNEELRVESRVNYI